MNVAIVGSRAWPERHVVDQVVALLPEGTTVVTGGATGADTMAEQAARGRGWNPTVIRPSFPKPKEEGKEVPMWLIVQAFHSRNQKVVDLSDCVVALTVDPKETKDTIHRAQKKGIQVVEIELGTIYDLALLEVEAMLQSLQSKVFRYDTGRPMVPARAVFTACVEAGARRQNELYCDWLESGPHRWLDLDDATRATALEAILPKFATRKGTARMVRSLLGEAGATQRPLGPREAAKVLGQLAEVRASLLRAVWVDSSLAHEQRKARQFSKSMGRFGVSDIARAWSRMGDVVLAVKNVRIAVEEAFQREMVAVAVGMAEEVIRRHSGIGHRESGKPGSLPPSASIDARCPMPECHCMMCQSEANELIDSLGQAGRHPCQPSQILSEAMDLGMTAEEKEMWG